MINYRKHRESLGLTQAQYWSVIGLRQSTGSRFEAGRAPHKAAIILHQIAFGDADEAARMIAQVRRIKISKAKLKAIQRAVA